MKTYIDKNYGADADGNRGITVIEYELEQSDAEEIIAQILDEYPDSDDRPASMMVTIGGIELEIDVGDWL